MKEIHFTVWTISADMCRITPNDCRQIFKDIEDGSCICSLDVMLSAMNHINTEVEKLGYKASFYMA